MMRTPGRTRTRNRPGRNRLPYPLGHGGWGVAHCSQRRLAGDDEKHREPRREPVTGLEPAAFRLQGGRTTSCASPARLESEWRESNPRASGPKPDGIPLAYIPLCPSVPWARAALSAGRGHRPDSYRTDQRRASPRADLPAVAYRRPELNRRRTQGENLVAPGQQSNCGALVMTRWRIPPSP